MSVWEHVGWFVLGIGATCVVITTVLIAGGH